MSGSQLNSAYIEMPSRNLEWTSLPGGPTLRWFSFSWTNQAQYYVNFAKEDEKWKFLCNSMLIDNTGNSSNVTVTQLVTETDGVNIVCAGNVSIMRPAAAVLPLRLKIVSTSAAGQLTRLSLFNFPMPTF